MSGISEFVERVHSSLLEISVGRKRVPETFSFYGELEDRPLHAPMDGDARCGETGGTNETGHTRAELNS